MLGLNKSLLFRKIQSFVNMKFIKRTTLLIFRSVDYWAGDTLGNETSIITTSITYHINIQLLQNQQTVGKLTFLVH